MLMKRTRNYWSLVCLFTLFAIAFVVAVFSLWEDSLWEESMRLADEAEVLLERHDPERALGLYYMLRQRGYGPSFMESRWHRIAAGAYARLNKPLELAALYIQDPECIHDSEQAALLVLETLYSRGESDRAGKLREAWRGREKDNASWVMLDADYLIRMRQFDAAEALLEAQSFDHQEEAHRLLRLALLQENVTEAEACLNRALALDPENPDLRYTLAWIHEAQGNTLDAFNAYAGLQASDIESPLYREILGNFLFRHGKREEALAVWSDGLKRDPNDSLWFKSFFWSKMLHPVKLYKPAENSPLTSLVVFSESIPQNRFWDNKRFSRLSRSSIYSHELQEVYWLSFFENMRLGYTDRLLHSYQHVPCWNFFNPETRLAVYNLALIRGARPEGFEEQRTRLQAEVPQEFRHPLFVELDANADARLKHNESFTLSQPTQALVDSGAIYTAILLADGLPEAALKVGPNFKARSEYPEWFILSYARALEHNRSPKAAFVFLPLQGSEALEVYRGELAFTLGRREEASRLLVSHAEKSTQSGKRAAYLLAVDSLDQHDYASAQSWLKGNRALLKSIQGKELSAQIAIARGDLAAADKQMRSISNQSELAQRYLATRAQRGSSSLTKQMAYLAPNTL